MKGAMSPLAIVAIVLMVVWAVGGFASFGLPGLTTLAVQAPPTTGGVQPTTQCPNTLGTSVSLAARNPLNASLQYEAAVFKVTPTGDASKIAYSVTGGASGLGTGVNMGCGKTYDFYYLGDTSYASKKVSGQAVSGYSAEVYTDLPQSTDVEFKIIDENNQDINSTSGWYYDVSVPTSAVAFSSGSTKNYLFKTETRGNAAQFGSDEIQNVVCANFNSAVYSTTGGVAFDGMTKLSSVPSYPASLGYDACWALPSIKSVDAAKQYGLTIRADLGEPGASDDVTFQVFDGNYYATTTGGVNSGVGNDVNLDVGQTNRYITLNFS